MGSFDIYKVFNAILSYIRYCNLTHTVLTAHNNCYGGSRLGLICGLKAAPYYASEEANTFAACIFTVVWMNDITKLVYITVEKGLVHSIRQLYILLCTTHKD